MTRNEKLLIKWATIIIGTEYAALLVLMKLMGWI